MRRLHAGQRVLARDSTNQLRKATVQALEPGSGDVWLVMAEGGAYLVLAGGDGVARWWPARDVHVSLAEAKQAQTRAALLREALEG